MKYFLKNMHEGRKKKFILIIINLYLGGRGTRMPTASFDNVKNNLIDGRSPSHLKQQQTA
jgi:hypothetical protein